MNPTHWLISTQVLRPCRKPGARARGFKWFDGQGGASVASENAALGNLSAWRAAHAAKLIVLERQGLAKLVSDRLKHLSSQRGVDAVLRDEGRAHVVEHVRAPARVVEPEPVLRAATQRR